MDEIANLETLLRASVEIAALKETVASQERQIVGLQCALRRATVRFDRRDDNESYRRDMAAAGRGHLVGG